MRDLTYGPYSHGEVLDRLHDGYGEIGRRFDLLDEGRRKIGELDTVVADEKAAIVEHNIDQGVKGSLDLKMGPDERLRNQAYRKYIVPWWQMQMRDGGWVEYPFGMFVWTIPDIDLAWAGAEEWNIVLPDQLDILNTQAPSIETGVTVYQGQKIVDALRWVLEFGLGITDLSLVEDSDVRFDQTKTWVLWEPKGPDWEEYRHIKSELRKRVGGFHFVTSGENEVAPHGMFGDEGTISGLAHAMYLERSEQLQRQGIGENQAGLTTWLSILSDWHRSMAWWPPHFSWDGRYVGRSGLDPRDLRPDQQTMLYANMPNSIMRDAKTTMNLGKWANLVIVSCTNPDGLYIQWPVAADQVMPDHPLAFRQTQRWVQHYESNSNTDNSDVLFGVAIMRLFEIMNTTDKAQWTGFCNPAHDPYDFFLLQVLGHPQLQEPALYHEHMVVLDLFTGDMEHGGYRAWLSEPWYGLIGYRST